MDSGFDDAPEGIGDKEPKNDKGGFFGMSISTLKQMVKEGAGAEELMAYIVLARGVNMRGEKRVSTHGVNSISNRLGISYRKAESALKWIEQQGIVHKSHENTTSPVPKKQQAKWILKEEPLDVYLANAITDGIGEGKKNPPLARIYNQVSLGSSGLAANARLDAVMLLMHLYHYQDMQDCGGVNPRAGIYKLWSDAENVWGNKVTEIPNSNGAMFEIEPSNQVMFTKFAAEALFYVTDKEERHSRFWDALSDLRRLGFLYEVTQVWSADPNGKEGSKAEPLYTLYVHDRHARKSEPYLQRLIHTTAVRTGAIDAYTEAQGFLGNDEDSVVMSGVATGRLRYIAHKKAGGYPIGIYRLRFRPKTKDVGMGIENEKRRVDQWAQILNKLN